MYIYSYIESLWRDQQHLYNYMCIYIYIWIVCTHHSFFGCNAIVRWMVSCLPYPCFAPMGRNDHPVSSGCSVFQTNHTMLINWFWSVLIGFSAWILATYGALWMPQNWRYIWRSLDCSFPNRSTLNKDSTERYVQFTGNAEPCFVVPRVRCSCTFQMFCGL